MDCSKREAVQSCEQEEEDQGYPPKDCHGHQQYFHQRWLCISSRSYPTGANARCNDASKSAPGAVYPRDADTGKSVSVVPLSEIGKGPQFGGDTLRESNKCSVLELLL